MRTVSDVVDRLRRPWADFYTVKDGKMTSLLLEAADEIERLQAVVDAARGYLLKHHGENCVCVACENLRALDGEP